MLGILYDIHGNLAALDAILAEAEREGVDRWVLGGDYCTFGPWPKETLARVRELPAEAVIRGNVDRWLEGLEGEEERFGTPGPVVTARRILSPQEVAWLVGLPESAEVDGILYVHGSPLSDEDSFPSQPSDDDERLLDGVSGRLVVFGHSHVQFRRPGPNGTDLANPGSAGMPLDGDTRAAWALWRDGELELRRTAYDVEPAIGKMREYKGDWPALVAERLERGAPAASEG
jgi:predicted phosphodiesterase